MKSRILISLFLAVATFLGSVGLVRAQQIDTLGSPIDSTRLREIASELKFDYQMDSTEFVETYCRTCQFSTTCYFFTPKPIVSVDSTAVADSIACPAEPVQQEEERKFRMAVRTNMLEDVCLVPNIGLEFWLGNGWTIGGQWAYDWIKIWPKHIYWRMYGGEIDVRKYFGKKSRERAFSGHHAGLYLQGYTYDVEFGKAGNVSPFSYGVGLEYGYSLPVSKSLNIDFGIGLGYFGGLYYEYLPMETHRVWQRTLQRNWFGPTRAEITLVWIIEKSRKTTKSSEK